jgi:hypothetical protein
VASPASRPRSRRSGRCSTASPGPISTPTGRVAAELAGWLAERELDVEPTTLSNYRDVVRCCIVPHVGARQLYTLDKRVIHDMYKTLRQRGGRDGAPLSPTTVRIVHQVLMKAVRDIGITIEGVRQPRILERQIMGRKGVWTPAQATTFLRHHAGHRLRAAWLLAIVVGVRRGELAGLRWSGVDLDRGVLLVHRQRTTTSRGVVEKAPKGKSRRAIAIGPALVTELRAHRARQDAEKALAGVIYRDGGYVFCREDGMPYYPKYFTDQWTGLHPDRGRLGRARPRGRRLRSGAELRHPAHPVRPADRELSARAGPTGRDARRGHRDAAVLPAGEPVGGAGQTHAHHRGAGQDEQTR